MAVVHVTDRQKVSEMQVSSLKQQTLDVAVPKNRIHILGLNNSV